MGDDPPGCEPSGKIEFFGVLGFFSVPCLIEATETAVRPCRGKAGL